MSHEDIDATKAPLIEHLVELRTRLVQSAIGFVIAFCVCFYFSDDIYRFLAQPLANALADRANARMIYTAPQEAFFTYLKLSMWAAFCISFPLIAGQIWMFVAPGLYRDERKAFLPFLAATPVLFTMGAALVYYGIMPLAMKFFLSFEAPGGQGALPMELETKVNEYLSLVMTLILAFGACFQLPVALSLMARVGFVSERGLREKRKYAIVGIAVVAAVLTPPDPISQIGLGIPIYLLYELSILSVRQIERARLKREAARDAELGL